MLHRMQERGITHCRGEAACADLGIPNAKAAAAAGPPSFFWAAEPLGAPRIPAAADEPLCGPKFPTEPPRHTSMERPQVFSV
jgi:hypothetical protein